MFLKDYYVYTDGSCSNNGKKNALAGIGIYFGVNDPRNVSKRVEGRQTNNVAELTAIIETYKIIENDVLDNKKITIVSDSEYAIKCVTTYGEKCFAKNWNVDIPNKELVKYAFELYRAKPNVQFMHVMAHTGKSDIHSIGNENADKLANQAIGQESCPYEKKPKKIYLNVPFEKKDEAKMLGAKWEFSKKKWYIYDDAEDKDQIVSLFGK